MKSIDEWISILYAIGVREQTARKWAPEFSAQVHEKTFNLDWDEIDDFVAQVVYESQKLEYVKENLNYRAERLHQVFYNNFRTVEAAIPFAGQPAKTAERVYGRRRDLGNDQPGDGLKYIGRGLLMVTGKGNYEHVQTATGEPVVDKPELLETPRVALMSAIAWWEKNIPDSAVGHPDLVSRRVNGGVNGLDERIKLSQLVDQTINQPTKATA